MAEQHPEAATNRTAGPGARQAAEVGERRPPEGFTTRKQRLMWIRHLADTGDWYSAIVQLADELEEGGA